MDKCERWDCDKAFYKIIKTGNGPKGSTGFCKKHYIQINYTDKALEKLKKYWIVPAIGIALIGLLSLWI